MKDLQDIYKDVHRNKLYFSYYGTFDDSITSNIIDIISPFLKGDVRLKKQNKKVPFLIAECYQNIVRHSNQDYESQSHSIENLQISVTESEVSITSVNEVSLTQIEKLDRVIDDINKLDQSELKALKQQVLTEGSFSDKGGAGLGIIEMARKTGYPIRKKFITLDSGIQVFMMTLDVLLDEDISAPVNDQQVYVDLYKQQLKAGMLLAYRGDMSKDSNVQLIEMLENRFLDNEIGMTDQFEWFHVMVELLQNMAKHGLKIDNQIPGVFGIQIKSDFRRLLCGNFVPPYQLDSFTSLIDELNGLSQKELEARYLESLGKEISEQSNGGQGLIEIARISKHKLEYLINQSKKTNFFLLGVKIS